MDKETDTVFRDMIFVVLLGFVAIVVLLLPHLNPPREGIEQTIPAGNVIVTIDWPDGWSTDVDLWVRAPGERPVGYSRKDGNTFNLLRDDLGTYRDNTGQNRETAMSRGILAGQYVVNLHLFSNYEGTFPVPVGIEVVVVTPSGKVEQILIAREILSGPGQELTVFRFRLDGDGNLARESVNKIQTPLRSNNKGPG